MNVVDVIIIALLILGGVAGFKAGVIKKLTDFIGMFVVIILAFYLKNYISVIMYENLPFFNFFGLINGGHSDWCEVESHGSFDLHFSNNQ